MEPESKPPEVVESKEDSAPEITDRRDPTEKYERTEVTEFRNLKGRTFEFPFSSEYPVERYFGKEVLRHNEESIDFSRLNDGAPLLFNHNPDKILGVVERAWLDPEKRQARAKVRFSRNKFASEVLEDVKDNILRGISFGYSIGEMEEEEGDFVANRWFPHELSVVSIPADPTIGIGRSLLPPETSMPKTSQPEDISIEDNSTNSAAPVVEEVETRSAATTASTPIPPMEETTPEKAVDTAAAVDAEVQRALEEESVRTSTIYSVCREHGAEELTEKLIRERNSVDEARESVLALIKERSEKNHAPIRSTDMTAINTSASEVGLEEKEVKRFSFLRALNALANPADRQAQDAAAFEREVSEEASNRYGRPAKGILVPNEVLRSATRDLNVGTATAGGNLVATDLLSGSFIDLLRNKSAMMQAGVTTLTGLEGNIAIPRQTSASTAYWVGEGASPTESQQAFDQVNLTPKTVGAFVDYTRKTLLQSSIDVEAFVKGDLAKVLALEIDRAAIYGSGSSNQPLGLTGTSGIGTQTITTYGTFAEYIGMETDVAAANADAGSLRYIVNATARGALKSTEKASNTAQFVWENNEINGYPALVSNQLANNDALFGDFSQFVVGMWSGLDLTVDPYAGSTSGNIRIIALQDLDFAVKQAGAFCYGT